MDLGLQGKRAIVTGGTRGIGRAIVERLVAEGCAVGFCARNQAQIDDAVKALGTKGAKVIGAKVDVGDGPALKGFIEQTAGALGGLDVMVANVSGAMMGGIDEESWRKGFEVDILGTVRCCETALPFLEKSGQGAIVVVGSVASVETLGPRRAYNGIKASMLPYIKALAQNAAPKNVRANVVSPGSIYFKDGVWNMIEKNMPERYAAMLARNPMGRMGKPEEIANTVVFLASPAASFVSGANLIVDGALSQRV